MNSLVSIKSYGFESYTELALSEKRAAQDRMLNRS